VSASLEAATRTHYPQIVAALTRRFGAAHLAVIEDAVQTAMVRALERWAGNVPDRADSWLLRVAYNQTVDALRAATRLGPLLEEYQSAELAAPSVDDELALIFLCCHPALSRAAQLTLTLKVACGLTPRQIAIAFLTSEPTVEQRLVRAKQRLRELEESFDIPDPEHLPTRLGSILEVLYLMFTEGYSPADGAVAVRDELCREALRLARLLTDSPRTDMPAVEALRALFCFQYARASSRSLEDGSLLMLFEQDRSRWDRDLIEEGFAALQRARQGEALSRFHLEAGIAAYHAAARDYQSTDWQQILFMYDALRARFPSLVVDVNRAVAVAMVGGAAVGLDELDSIPERELVNRYPYALATYAELHTSLGHVEEARAYLTRALKCQPSTAQRRLLQRKLAALNGINDLLAIHMLPHQPNRPG
jgi:RNA polymerase sigma-70 factor, ECF subfamily